MFRYNSHDKQARLILLKLVTSIALCMLINGFTLQAASQPDSTDRHYVFETQGGYGFVMPHHTSIAYNIREHVVPIHLRMAIKCRGTKAWQRKMHNPLIGMGLHRTNLGNDNIYGHATALYGFARWPLYRPINLEYQMGFGTAWISKKFDIEKNYTNIAIGSNLNIYFDATLTASLPINKTWHLNYYLQFIHFSNGKMQSPNKGLNLITNNLGVAYHFGNLTTYKGTVPSPIKPAKHQVWLWAGAGAKTVSRDRPDHKFASTLGLQYRKASSPFTAWGGGIDLFYDKSLPEQEATTNEPLTEKYHQLGIHADLDKHLASFIFTMQVGTYLYTPISPEAPVYTRLGLRYAPNAHLWFNVSLKAHYAIASFIEWGMGFNIWQS